MVSESIPVLRPALPSADRLLPYLRRIDEGRTYTNFGPLVEELSDRLARVFELDDGGHVVCTSSGTAALCGAILATVGRASVERPLAMVPAFTFPATALAAELCGYEVLPVDVSPDSWALEVETVRTSPQLDRVGVVLPVAPFGRPLDPGPWLSLQGATGVSVVIDAAAGFETLAADPSRYLGQLPVVLSLHATKSFSTAEGGCVLVRDRSLGERIVQATNFGFYRARDCEVASLNGKMSEYHAAIGLAELDGWPEKSANLLRVCQQYRETFAAANVSEALWCAPDVCSSNVLLETASSSDAEGVERSLASGSIGVRRWYGGGLHRQHYYAAAERRRFPVTDRLASRLLGLPMAPDLPGDAIDSIVEAVASGLSVELPG